MEALKALPQVPNTSDFVWIGLRGLATVGNYSWLSGEPLTYDNWELGYPVDLEGCDCVIAQVYDGTWTWYNTFCDQDFYGALCELDPL